MKRHLFLLICIPALILATACTPMEEKRDALMEQARAHEKAGRCAEASAAASEAFELDPALADAQMLLGRCSMSTGKNKDATRHFSEALELAPNTVEAMMALSRLYLIENQIDLADEYAAKAAELDADRRELAVLRAGIFMERGDHAAAVPLFEELLKSNPEDEESLIGLASAYINSGEKEKAMAVLESSLEKRESSPAVLSLLFNIARKDQDYAAAENYLNKLLALNPASEDIILQLIDVLALSGQRDKIPALLEAFLEKYPEASRIRLGLITIASSQGQFDKALELIDTAPDQNGALNLGKASILAAAGRIEECIALLKQISANPATAAQGGEARMNLAELYLQRDMTDDAEKELNALLNADPAHAGALLMRGRIRLSKRDINGAIADYEAILKKSPNNSVAALSLA
ncbi:MAG: tetratricopeptide repeat protein, partial [Desulfovibrio sp.]|nr:tetratricopeptide repeat protein [Desulfovibrio sp.]